MRIEEIESILDSDDFLLVNHNSSDSSDDEVEKNDEYPEKTDLWKNISANEFSELEIHIPRIL